MKIVKFIILVLLMIPIAACATDSEFIENEAKVPDGKAGGIGEKELARLSELRKTRSTEEQNLSRIIRETPNYSISQYLSRYPNANNPGSKDFSVGGYDILDIRVYEEPDLSKEVRVGSDGYISFPMIGRIRVEGLTSSEIEKMISAKLAQGQFLLNAHVSVNIKEYKSKQFMVLGAVKSPGTYPIQGRERILDAISKGGGIDWTQGGKQAMLIRNEASDSDKLVIRIDLSGLLKGADQYSNLLMADDDLLYVPKAENFSIIGQVRNPGSYPYLDKDMTIVEAISRAGGFTPVAAPNRTQILRMENGKEKTIKVNVNAITDSGRKAQDISVLPGDVIVVPESMF
jgi:polysaccharide export outer membrane protein